MIDDVVPDDPPLVPAALDPRFPHARQWLREVVGDSMDALGITNGDLAHIADWPGTGLALKTGQVVEVTRFRADGGLCEVTLKEVEAKGGKYKLWPRSNNPRWQEPVAMNGDGEAGVEVRVTGLLLAAIRRF